MTESVAFKRSLSAAATFSEAAPSAIADAFLAGVEALRRAAAPVLRTAEFGIGGLRADLLALPLEDILAEGMLEAFAAALERPMRQGAREGVALERPVQKALGDPDLVRDIAEIWASTMGAGRVTVITEPAAAGAGGAASGRPGGLGGPQASSASSTAGGAGGSAAGAGGAAGGVSIGVGGVAGGGGSAGVAITSATQAAVRSVLLAAIARGESIPDALAELRAQWARSQASSLVQMIADQQRTAIREIIAEAITRSANPLETARDIRQVIGLRPDQVRSLQRLRATLQANQTPVAETRKALEKAARRKLKERSELIARTENSTAISAAREIEWLRAAEEGEIDPDVRRKWIVRDPCRICRGLSRLPPVRLGEPWVLEGKVYFAPPAHPNCKCSVGLVRPLAET